MTRVHETYLEKAKAILDRLAAEEADSIARAGAAVADRVAAGSADLRHRAGRALADRSRGGLLARRRARRDLRLHR